MGRISVLLGASREEAPEEIIFLSRDAAPDLLVGKVSKAGRGRDYPKKGRRTSGGFGRDFGSSARPDRSKDQRTFGPRSQVERTGSSKEGAARWEATPELVSQDRERAGRPKGFISQVTNTGRSFARRSGGWQRCRPPFLLCEPRQAEPQRQEVAHTATSFDKRADTKPTMRVRSGRWRQR